MTIRLRIDYLEWDAWNLEHITRHGVTRNDIETALRGKVVVKPSYKNRFLIFGTALSDRIIAIVVGEVPGKPNVYYVFSARPASRKERRDLEQEDGS